MGARVGLRVEGEGDAVGALCFNVCCAATFVSPDTPEGEKLVSVWMEGVAGTVGSLLFVLAALIEWAHNADATPRQRVFWLCSSYFLGSVLFLVGSGATLVFGVCECARPGAPPLTHTQKPRLKAHAARHPRRLSPDRRPLSALTSLRLLQSSPSGGSTSPIAPAPSSSSSARG